MKSKISMVIIAHLSDMSYEQGIFGMEGRVKIRINFIKLLIMNYKDTNVELSNDELNDWWRKAQAY